MNLADALRRYAELFETVSPSVLPRLGEYFSEDARFKDPFNDVRGLDAIRRVFERMFETCRDIRFDVHRHFLDGDTGCLFWTMTFRPNVAGMRNRTWIIEGASRLRFAPDGRIVEHVDYWDSGEYFYMKLPLVGALVRGIRNRVA